ncbi:hypothetical protein [Streptomyces sp. NPDC058735]|uniref:hypothetical protein n=1 Tax=unclassified Streptomyces TaxID=2593676 RepID=UPI0036CF6F51
MTTRTPVARAPAGPRTRHSDVLRPRRHAYPTKARAYLRVVLRDVGVPDEKVEVILPVVGDRSYRWAEDYRDRRQRTDPFERLSTDR